MKTGTFKSVMVATAVTCVAVGFSLSRSRAEDGPPPTLQPAQQAQLVDAETGLPEVAAASHEEVGQDGSINMSDATALFQSVEEAVAAIQDIPMSIDAQGEMKLAGVVGMRTDEAGRLIVELRWDGDFEKDPVLILKVPVSEGPDGQPETVGLQGFTFGNETVTLTIEMLGGGSGDVGSIYTDDGKCKHHAPVPPDPENPPYCGGTCPGTVDECKFDLVDVVKPGGGVQAPGGTAALSPFPDTLAVGVVSKQEMICDCLPPDP